MLENAALTMDGFNDQDYLSVNVLLNAKSTREKSVNVLVFRFQGQIYAYVNHCMHMHRRLNCQQDAIFDSEGRWLRCSMHGFIFEPQTGVCLSPVCEGQSLQAIKAVEQEGKIVFKEKHLEIISVRQHKSLARGAQN